MFTNDQSQKANQQMNFFTKQEVKIINGYAINDRIPIKRYIVDFVMNNPFNFPISSSIMATVHMINANTIKNYYKSQLIVDAAMRLGKYTYSRAISADCVSFSLLVLLLCHTYTDYYITVFQKFPNVIISIEKEDTPFAILIDKTASSLLSYNTRLYNLKNIIQSGHYKTLDDISQNCKTASFYHVKFDDPTDDVKLVDLIGCISTCTVTDFYAPSILADTLYSRSSIAFRDQEDSSCDTSDIFDWCKTDISTLQPYFIKHETSNDQTRKSIHTDTVIDGDPQLNYDIS